MLQVDEYIHIIQDIPDSMNAEFIPTHEKPFGYTIDPALANQGLLEVGLFNCNIRITPYFMNDGPPMLGFSDLKGVFGEVGKPFTVAYDHRLGEWDKYFPHLNLSLNGTIWHELGHIHEYVTNLNYMTLDQFHARESNREEIMHKMDEMAWNGSLTEDTLKTYQNLPSEIYAEEFKKTFEHIRLIK